MELSERISRVAARCRAFFGAREPGHFLLNVNVPAEIPTIPPLYEFDLDRQLTDWLDYKLAAAKAGWQAKTGLDDDTVPSVCPHFGIGEHSAWLGMEMRLQETTCLPVPVLSDLNDVDKLTLREGTKWYRYMKEGYEYLRSRKDGTFVLSVRGALGPMDLANALRGDDFFTDVLLDPQGVHRLMAFCVRALQWWYPRVRGWADEFEGGHFYMYHSSWMGPNYLGHITNDAAMLCGPRIYDEFAFPYEAALCEPFGGVLYHVHNEKLHFAPGVAELPHVVLLEVTNDPKTPPALSDLPRVMAATGSANLMLHGDSDQVRAHVNELKTRNVFLDVQCRDYADAEDVIAFVRAHSRVR